MSATRVTPGPADPPAPWSTPRFSLSLRPRRPAGRGYFPKGNAAALVRQLSPGRGGQHADQRLRLPLRQFPRHRQRRRNSRRQAGPRLPVRPGPIYSSDGSTACAPFPADPDIQNACHSSELPYNFNTLSATNAKLIPRASARLARRIAFHWTTFARTLDPGPGWRPYRATSAPGGNNIEILSTGSAATGALPVPADPIAASNCAALWAAQPPFTGSFPAQLADSEEP